MNHGSNRRQADFPLTTAGNFSDHGWLRVGSVAYRRRMQFCASHECKSAQYRSPANLGTGLTFTRNYDGT